MASLVACRARQLDSWASDFLARHSESTVLHLGCGLDSRVYRLNPAASVAWVDVDFPDVIELRHRLATVFPTRPGYRAIGSSILDFGWLAEIPKDRPTMVVAEGLFMYLSEDAITALLGRIIDHAGSGRLAFDSHPHRLVQWLGRRKVDVRGTGARFHWGLGDADEIRELDPRLVLIAERRAHELPGVGCAPLSVRLLVRAIDVVPSFRIMRCVLCRFARA